jgi:hypothetical protein
MSSENDQMKNILDLKQNDWITIEKKTPSNTTKTPNPAPKSYVSIVSNSFSTLQDLTPDESPDIPNLASSERNITAVEHNPTNPNVTNKSKINMKHMNTQAESSQGQESIKDTPVSLVIGDSMTI